MTDNSTLASGAYDLQFSLYDAVSAGTQQGANVTLSNVPVTGGIFTASLDFGSAPFAAGAPRLQIGVRLGEQQRLHTPHAAPAARANTVRDSRVDGDDGRHRDQCDATGRCECESIRDGGQ
ncbi:MAG: hypothetical protein U0Y68_14020 [Blastocatellia bacterium]